MTSIYNMEFTIFVVDARPFEVLHRSLDVMFGGHFVEDLEFAAAGRARYENYVFGLAVGCVYEETWSEGRVYRLAGVNDGDCWHDTTEKVDVTFHVLHMLRNLGAVRLMTLAQFRDESNRRRVSR
jgi:hypothetical protein